MKNSLRYLLLIGILCASQFNLNAQIESTPYDQLPGNNPIYKPSYNESFPSWAKKLYEYPVNFIEIENDYQQYTKEHGKQKNAIIRYYKIWRKIVSNYTNIDGEIILPSNNKNITNKRLVLNRAPYLTVLILNGHS